MTFPILVEQTNGKFTASVLGSPTMSATAATKEGAVAAVTARFRAGVATGEVVLVNVGEPALGLIGVSGLAGRFKDDPTLEDIVREAYRERDAEKAAEFPE